MKHFNSKISILLVCLSLQLLIPLGVIGQLSGNYTINPTISVSNTNYLDWASAVSDLLSGSRSDGGTAQGSGVSGAVIITVYDTVYANTSIAITQVSGASSTNTILFKSAKGDSSKCRLQYASGSSTTDDWVLNLNGADFITFSRIGFERTGTNTYGTVVQIGNDADNNKFIRCLMKGEKKPSSITKGFQTGIGSCVYFIGNGDTTEFTQNRFLYGYNGIYNLNAGSANTFSNNVCDTPGSAGIYVNSQTSFKVIGNIFNMGDFGAGLGHYTCYALRLDVSQGFIVANNKAVVTAVNAQVCRAFVFSSNTNSSSVPAMIYNNTIYNSGGTGNCNGIAINGCQYLNIFYNNILVNSSLSDGAALFQYITTTNVGNNLVNNNFINKGAGYSISAGDANSSGFDSVDYNNLYSAGTYLSVWGSSTAKYTSLAAYKSATGKCSSCLSLDPGFVSNSDLHVSNIAINGKALPYPKILFDMDNDTRNSTSPDIGSDEFFPVTTDAGLSFIDSPSYFCAGKQAVKVRFQNYGIDTIKSVQIGWSVNGVSQTGSSWTGALASGLSSATISLGTYTFASNTAYAFKVWTYNPNGAPDGKKLNDTLKLTKYSAISGNYTIGDTNVADFKTFNVAITTMAQRGICGAVTFNVFNGTYKEQLGLTQVPGMGSSSPVTFQSISNDSSKVLITLLSAANSGSNNGVIQLRGASYVTFKGVTFERTGTNPFAQVVHIMNGSHHNTFANCQMFGLPLTVANTSAVNIWSDQSKDDYNTFRNNYIKWGNVSLLFTNTSSTVRETGTVIENNVFEGGLNNSVQVAYNDGIVIKGNTFLNVSVALSGNSDILLKDCDSNINVSGNYFKSTNTSNSIVLSACNASTSKPGIVSNNSIVRSTGNGIVLDSTLNMHIVFNSVNFSSSSGTNAGIFTTGYSSNTVIQNNNIVMQSGEVFHITFGTEVSSSSHNNLWAKGLLFAYSGTDYSNLTDLVLGTGKNANSFSLNPFFTSGTDLHIKNPLLKGAGTPISGVSKDIDGESRNSTAPDIGADEFKLSPNDAGITELVNPIAGSCAGSHPIEIVIKNFGNDTLKTATVSWTAAGIAKTPYSWTGNLPTNAADTFIIGTHNFVGSLNPKFVFISTLPNGQTDGISFNDTLTTNRSLRALPAANAGPDKSVCNGDTLNIGQGSITGQSYKWYSLSGIVLGTNSKLNVKPGVQTKYILEVTNVTFGCSKRDTIEISVNAATVANAGTDKTVCPGSTAQLGTSSQVGYTYSWTSVPTGFSSSIANPTVTPAQTASYILLKTNSSTGCKGTDDAIVTVAPVPNSDLIGKTSACIDDISNYSTTGTAGNSYSWTVTGGSTISGQNTKNIGFRWMISDTGIVTLIETNSFSCRDTVTANVIVSPNPIIKFGVSSACLGDASLFTDSSVDVLTYKWDFGDGDTSIIKDPIHIYPSTLVFYPQLIGVSSFGCIDTLMKQVQVNELPEADFTYVKQGSRTIDFKDASTVSGGTINSWKWHFGDGDSSILDKPSHTFALGSFTVKLCVVSSAGCKDCITQTMDIVGLNETSADKNLYVMPNPGSGIFNLVSSQAIKAIILSNAMGQVIETILPADTNMKIDLSAQPAGIYFIRVEMNGQSKVLKLIKQ